MQRLRDLSGGKPVGFKLCVGRRSEFKEICEEMLATGILPDFITVDGAEGGTGAAPSEYTDSVGMPYEPALRFIAETLEERGLRTEIKLIASGKVVTAFDLVSALALGADICNSARAFMLATGCIQALRCDTNKCPTGITTMDPKLTKGLVVEDKWRRVDNFHRNTVAAARELMASIGVRSPADLDPSCFLRGKEWEYRHGSIAG